MTLKLYAYVDESWHGRGRETLIVAVVIIEGDQSACYQLCEETERDTAKSDKWTRTSPKARFAYMQRILDSPAFRGRLYYAVHPTTEQYQVLIARSIAAALVEAAGQEYRATVRIDALSRKDESEVRRHLHHLGTRVRKVRGVRKDENDALIRLADVMCGLVRAAANGHQVLGDLLASATAKGSVIRLEVGRK